MLQFTRKEGVGQARRSARRRTHWWFITFADTSSPIPTLTIEPQPQQVSPNSGPCIGALAPLDSLYRYNQTLGNIPLLQKNGFFAGSAVAMARVDRRPLSLPAATARAPCSKPCPRHCGDRSMANSKTLPKNRLTTLMPPVTMRLISASVGAVLAGSSRSRGMGCRWAQAA